MMQQQQMPPEELHASSAGPEGLNEGGRPRDVDPVGQQQPAYFVTPHVMHHPLGNGYSHAGGGEPFMSGAVQQPPPAGIDIDGLQHQLQGMMVAPRVESEQEEVGVLRNEYSETGDGGLLEGEADDDDEEDGPPVKLFVGQVPKSMSEEDIFPTFNDFGPLKDVAIIRDKHTGMHRGCAFVTFWSVADAEQCQQALHNIFQFPKGRKPLQVKPAEPAPPDSKLFIGMLALTAGEEEVCEMFGQFGEIKEVHMIRNQDGDTKCAAFLRFQQRESAVRAIESMNNNFVMDGATRPLIVKFADNRQQRFARQQEHSRQSRMIHAMPPAVGYQGYANVPHMPHQMGVPHPHAGQYAVPHYPQGYPGAGSGQHPHYMYPAYQNTPAAPYGYAARPEPVRISNPRPSEGPPGANLFIYHLPHDLTDADLATAFNPFGNVISAKVYVDRFTGESKGFGFVSYDSGTSANQAIEQMNGFQIGNKRLKVQHKRVNSSNRQNQSSGDDS